MKRIVIACDGTWNRLDARWPTNVVRAAQAVLPVSPDGVVQMVHHLDGVGSGVGTGTFAKAWDRLVGGAFGEGIDGRLEEAYRVLVFNHEPGDEIFLLGYSRGAFLARSLAGLIRCAGIVRRESVEAIPLALQLYKRHDPLGRRPNAPRGPGEPPVVGPDDAAARSFREFYAAEETPAEIAYIGVWDTVGSLGIPDFFLLSQILNRGLGFHDTTLSRRVLAARHAVAIDERRATFKPSLWDNLAELNAETGGETGGEAGGEMGAGRYLQMWFPGDHGRVGGGSQDVALSSGAALWVLEGAAAAGLALDEEALAELRAQSRSDGDLLDPRPGLVTRVLRAISHDRTGPEDPAEVSEAAVARWIADPGYRPRSLGRVAGALDERARRGATQEDGRPDALDALYG